MYPAVGACSRRGFLAGGGRALGAALLFARSALAERGPRRALEGRYASAALGRDVRYAIHLPPAGLAADAGLPILYFLHGFRDDETTWESEGFADICHGLMERGDIPPLAVALPDGGRGFYTNAYREGPRAEDAVFPDFVRFVEAKLLGSRPREKRAIAGISMGGYGAVKIALKHPDDFVAAAAMSGAFLKPGEFYSESGGRMGDRLREIFGPPGSEAMRRQNDVLYLVDRAEPRTLPAFYLSCGTRDRYGFERGTRALGDALAARGIATEIHIEEGRHSFGYWRRALPGLLRFVAARLGSGV